MSLSSESLCSMSGMWALRRRRGPATRPYPPPPSPAAGLGFSQHLFLGNARGLLYLWQPFPEGPFACRLRHRWIKLRLKYLQNRSWRAENHKSPLTSYFVQCCFIPSQVKGLCHISKLQLAVAETRRLGRQLFWPDALRCLLAADTGSVTSSLSVTEGC